jgi:F0F1-type ATP synthase assembly protein I
MAPGRPALHPDQIGLLVFTLLALGAGIYAVIRFLL